MTDTSLTTPLSQPWLKLDSENTNWFARFEVFRNMGPGRSLLGAYRLVRQKPVADDKNLQIPSSWSAAYHKYNWVARAEAFDVYELAKTSEQLEEKRFENKQKRLKLLDKAFDKAYAAIEALSVDRMTNLADLTALLRLVITESRAEYNDQPAPKDESKLTGTGPAIQINTVNYRHLIQALKPEQADFDIAEPERDIDEPIELSAMDRLMLQDGSENS